MASIDDAPVPPSGQSYAVEAPSPRAQGRPSLSEERVSARIAATLEAPAEARRVVAAALADCPDDLVGEIELLVTELVTNAVRHGGLTPHDVVELRVRVRPDRIRVEVAEGGPGFDPSTALQPDPEAVGGWGLLLVSRVASRWGVTRGTPNVAWFEIDLPR